MRIIERRQLANAVIKSLVNNDCTDLAFKVEAGLRDIAGARPDEIATREIRGSA